MTEMKDQNMTGKSDKSFEERARKLAEEIYDLDEMVYNALGSGLGRVFSKNREYSVRDMVETMEGPDSRYYLDMIVALIGNMARTIKDKDDHHEVFTKYDGIMREMDSLDRELEDTSMDLKLSRLNLLNLGNRFSKDQHLIICIGRTFNSSGNEIGLKLADRLQIDYYDSEIFSRVLERMEVEKERPQDLSNFVLTQYDGKDGSIKGRKKRQGLVEGIKNFNHFHGLSMRDALYFNQRDLLIEMAKKQDFVVMGRCAGRVMTNAGIPHVSIFITAPMDHRVYRLMKERNMTAKRAAKLIRAEDKLHGHYYRFYTGRKWGDVNNYDLCLNSASYGVDGTVDFIMRALESGGVDINRAALQKERNAKELEQTERAEKTEKAKKVKKT